jgi:putative DNA primase/helicase
MIWLARSEPGIPARLTEFDADGWLLNVQNGTINLRTGELQPHCRDRPDLERDRIPFEKGSDYELWDAFLWRVTDRNEDLYAYLRRFVGYLLVGDTSDQSLHFLYGLGRQWQDCLLRGAAALARRVRDHRLAGPHHAAKAQRYSE